MTSASAQNSKDDYEEVVLKALQSKDRSNHAESARNGQGSSFEVVRVMCQSVMDRNGSLKEETKYDQDARKQLLQ